MAAPAAAAVSSNTSQTNLAIPAQPKQQPPVTPQPRQQPLHPQIQTTLSLPSSLPPSLASASTATSPHRTGLTNWWKGFKSKTAFRRGEEPEVTPKGIFGVSLNTSIQYAYVNISITNASGNSEVYGRIPIIVAKCGVFLKDKATDVEGIFRVSGSAKRIKELQALFDSPPTYGKKLDWDGFNVHDAANVFRRYINHLPEPIVPFDHYFAFRKPLGTPFLPSGVDQENENPNTEDTIRTYQRLIGGLPKLNGQLLLYILDLLAVFAENSTQNLMPAPNLAAIFQPGLLSHPDHDMYPQEYRVSQEVLSFLIQHQDRFLPNTAVRREPSPQPQPPVEQRPIEQRVAPQPVEHRTAPQPVEHKTASQPLELKAAPQSLDQRAAPPAKYSGVYPLPDSPSPRNVSRRRTFTKKSETSQTFAGKVLRRNRSTRSPQSPRSEVEQEEPRRVSEGSVPNTGPVREEQEEEATTPLVATFSHTRKTPTPPPPTQPNESFEEGGNDVPSSVIQSTRPIETESVQTIEATGVVESTVNVCTEERPPESDHVTEMTQSTVVSDGAATESGGINGALGITSMPMVRSSSYREELDEVIDSGDQVTITSTDNTETETSDVDHRKDGDQKNKKNRRISKLPWSSSTDVSGEGKVTNIFSVTSAPSEDIGKLVKKLQKRRPKDGGVHVNAIGITSDVGRTGSLKSPVSGNDRGTLSPPPWTQQTNISLSSLKSSDLSRESHISSNRSSMEIPRSRTPVDRAVARPPSFTAIRRSHLVDDDLPTEVIMPAAQAEIPRKGSQSSNHSAASSGKGSKIGAWLKKKRGFSISSSTTGGGGGEISAGSD